MVNKFYQKIFLIIFFAIIIGGCASTVNYASAVNSWRGARIRSLFNVWGYPNKTISLPRGHRLYVYRYKSQTQTPMMVMPGSTSVLQTSDDRTFVSTTPGMITGGQTYYMRCTTWFDTNKQGIIVGTNFRGNSCAATKKQRISLSN